jgi:enoyl-CoA hydratase
MLRIERVESGAIAIWTVCRPETKNALSSAVMEALDLAIAGAAHDPDLRAIILTGEGNVFVSGGDLRELREKTSAADAERLSDAGMKICDGLGALDVPVIAAINGAAIGGGAELAVACDLRIADPAAKVCFKHVRMGLTTSWGTLGRLLSLVGPSTAARLLYLAHEVRAAEAASLGLIDSVSEEGASLAAAIAWAKDVAKGSPGAITEMKRLLRDAKSASANVRARERERFVATWTSHHHHEAVEAFFESRTPVWRSAKR